MIVGNGSAGCVLTARLAEDRKVSLALLETGDPHSPAGSDGDDIEIIAGNCNGKRRDAVIRSKSITACGETIRSTLPVEISTKEDKYGNNNPK